MDLVNDTFSMGSAAHAAKRAADAIIVLENRGHLDHQAHVEQINAMLKKYGESDANVTYPDLDDLKAVARELHAVFATEDTMTAASLLNTLLKEHAQAPRLSSHSATPWHLHVDSNDDAPWAEWFAASSALALAVLLAEKQRNPAGLCASPTCGRPFIDLGKGGGRKYCSATCATRERVASYRKRGQQ
ncbi:MAG TPA: CGNR zinc finger domain-containing protein [Candidatus Saccharimonadales bacterium]|nr:CGNR zinc finger domain-containing protein [Candidatus Saccharimonadales bacterium]